MSSNMPDELIRDILSRLPTKSLMRFKCVCKPWCELISNDSHFSRLQILRAIQRDGDHPLTLFSLINMIEDNDNNAKIDGSTGIGVLSHEPTVFKLENTFLDLCFDNFKLVGSCNGLVCLVSKSVVWLLNPYTREYKTVEFAKEFVFDRFTAYGFGYDPITEDYKLVLYVFDEINVYSLKDVNSCFTISTFPLFINLPIGIPDMKDLGAFCNGALHWLVRIRKYDFEETILCFDIEEKVVRDFPAHFLLSHGDGTVNVLGGKLCVFFSDYYLNIQIWVMNKYGFNDSWIQLFDIEKESLLVHDSFFRPLGLAINGEFLLLKENKHMVCYDPKQKTMRSLKFNGRSKRYGIEMVMNHVCSLVSLNSGTYLRNALGVELKLGNKHSEDHGSLQDVD